MSKPTLYVKQGCPWCVEALAYFNAKDIDLEIVDVRTEPNRMKELVEVSGQSMTPTFKHGDFLVADFDVDEFEAALNKNPQAREKLQV
ncbi:MAG: glutaredoxin domain-containing protein [Verrucomicrobia bacterium]|jgi:glutaredoxin 3|nr:glutathione S-transferase N-terminal domain-containing protein [Verrucomicrobiota bacterium]MDA0725106.1 glutaredoxin domain-containing protein [Verrucomicrobiota bacterium]MDA1047902.1 glutaredoxin domain-containing protein [Verrucomicrobiota bacterium]